MGGAGPAELNEVSHGSDAISQNWWLLPAPRSYE